MHYFILYREQYEQHRLGGVHFKYFSFTHTHTHRQKSNKIIKIIYKSCFYLLYNQLSQHQMAKSSKGLMQPSDT